MARSELEKNVDLSGVTVNVGTPTAATLTKDIIETTTGTTITAGKLRVTILNMGFVEAGDAEEDITVDGDVVQPGSEPVVFQAFYDRANNEFKTTPAITILNPDGARIRITTEE